MTLAYDYSLKTVILGESGAGKTSLVARFVDDFFNPSYVSTVGVEFRSVTVESEEGPVVKLQIWDTAGQERFSNMLSTYFRGISGLMIVYDVCDVDSFSKIEKWVLQSEQYAVKDVPKILIGNKIDLTHYTKISTDQGQRVADKFDMDFFETSAKSKSGVSSAFMNLASAALNFKLSHLEGISPPERRNSIKLHMKSNFTEPFGMNEKQCCSFF